MIVATVTDVRQQKIYNWTTYSGIALAFLLSSLATWSTESFWADIDIRSSLIGFAACGSIMLVCFVLFQIGGGDVKLLAMVGAFLGIELGIQSLLWTFVIGGATALIILIWRVGFLKLAKRVFHQFMVKIGFGKWDPLTEEENKQMKMPLYLAPSALAAAIVVKFSIVERLLSSVH